ncbi:MAG TPA: hypothetical protein PKL16_11440 [Anaerolineae bacterium]|nr:hypothetical protein [Anaerolineae bacterium]HQM15013.1 hypothetical protein [Anaerolineae bacterium]
MRFTSFCWLLVTGYWLLVTGCWLLVAGCWLLVCFPSQYSTKVIDRKRFTFTIGTWAGPGRRLQPPCERGNV